ncbi:MAG TPA: hypothetical protein VGG44_02440 [Tepidisphaeraceae bacterium]|jgi:hypothetical protein
MHSLTTLAMDLATTGFPIIFMIFAVGFAAGTMLFMFAKSVERRFIEFSTAPRIASSPGKKIEQARTAPPIEVELEAMRLPD